MSIITVVKNHFNALEANDMDSENLLLKIKQGEVFDIELKKHRDSSFHKKFMTMLDMVFHNQDKYDTKEDLLVEIKLKTGHYVEHLTTKGKIIYIPKSISFAEMDQLDFEVFYEKAVNVCLKYFVNIDNQELIDRISRF